MQGGITLFEKRYTGEFFLDYLQHSKTRAAKQTTPL